MQWQIPNRKPQEKSLQDDCPGTETQSQALQLKHYLPQRPLVVHQHRHEDYPREQKGDVKQKPLEDFGKSEKTFEHLLLQVASSQQAPLG
jgi:hypothetical protein